MRLFTRINFRLLITQFILIGIVIIPVLSIPQTRARASTFNVNNAGDDSDRAPGDGTCATTANVCTLRAALEEANAHSGPDTITIPPMTILINRELETRYRFGEDTSVSIVGAGQSLTIIDGQQRTRVFYFEARTGSHTISDLSIQNGYNLASPTAERWVKNGGGIFSEAKLSLINITITNGQAYSGGGIYGEHAFPNPQGDWNIPSLDLRNVTIQNSKAVSGDGWNTGGGLFSGSLLTASELYVYNNSAYVGGGLYQNSPKSKEIQTSSVKNFIIRGNVAVDGAGIENDYGNIDLSYGLIENNYTSGCRTNDPSCEYGAGAGIYNNEGSMNINSVTIQGNTVTQKRGYAGGLFSREQASLTSVSFIGNSAAVGAAIFNGNYDNVANSLTVNGSSFTSNVGRDSVTPLFDSMGGALYNIGTVNVTNTKFDNNHASVGGAIYNYLYMFLTNVSITNGQARIGSGIFNGNYVSAPNGLTLINTTISKNVGTSGAPESRGGAVFNYSNGYLNIVNSTMTFNQASRGGGLDNTGSVDIVNTILAGNVGWVESPDCRGQINSDGYNLVQNTSGCSYVSRSGDIVGGNPYLGLLNTSGPVFFQSLLGNSPAIDAGNNSRCPAFDTVGNPRPVGEGCDIGAYEREQISSVYIPITIR